MKTGPEVRARNLLRRGESSIPFGLSVDYGALDRGPEGDIGNRQQLPTQE